MTAFERLVQEMVSGRASPLMGDKEAARTLLNEVYSERYHSADHHQRAYQIRVNLQAKADSASYAGWITSNNPETGPYSGTSFVWFPGDGGSVAVLVIGTDGFGNDVSILSRPGHARRLKALSRMHRGCIWVKSDLLDTASEVPSTVTAHWPEITAALKNYTHVIYAAVPVRDVTAAEPIADLLDLFFDEHGTPLTGRAKTRWSGVQDSLTRHIFPQHTTHDIVQRVQARRFVVLEGPPGTGKTRMALQVAAEVGQSTVVQFHAARTYEDFVVGLFPEPTESGLRFQVRPGDLLCANRKAQEQPHVLVIDELNRADVARVLGEAIMLFEAGEADRSVTLPHVPAGYEERLRLSSQLYVVGTRNTADRSIAPMDIAIRRRFAFIELWPDFDVVQTLGSDLSQTLFSDSVATFTEYADDDALRLIPGHAYFIDWRSDEPGGRDARVASRLRDELMPLLAHYMQERLCGAAHSQIAGLLDRIEMRLGDGGYL